VTRPPVPSEDAPRRLLGAESAILVGNAPCSWGIMGGFDLDPPPDYFQVLDEIAESGYAGTELGDWGFMPAEAEVLRPELERRCLAMIGAFTPVALAQPERYDQAEARALRAARLLAGCKTAGALTRGPLLILADDASANPLRAQKAGRVEPCDSLSVDQLRALARGLEAVAAQVLDETGIGTVFHPHCGTCVETLAETTRLAEMTDERLIGLCYDTGHVAYAGDDPLDALNALGDRVWHAHFKDYEASVAERARRERWDYRTAVANGLFCELGRGAIDFRALEAMLRSRQYNGWIVVEDELPPGSGVPLESARRDRAFLRSLGL